MSAFRGPRARTMAGMARAGLAAVLLPLWNAASASDTPVTKIVVEGKPVSLTTTVPSLHGGKIFLPLAPVAAELRDAIEVDPRKQAIHARLSHTAERRSFFGATGEVWRDGALLAILPATSDVLVAGRPE